MCLNEMTPVEQMRDPEATRQTLIGAIADLNPDSAQWWQYNVSHRQFLLRLFHSPTSDWLMIATFSVQHLCGTPHWNQPELQFTIEPDPRCADESRWVVTDANAGFEMTCRNLYWGRNVGRSDESGWFSCNAAPGDRSADF
ncbi:hypothetical protein Fuma_02324 [Fuerstiella marisgermanici]|uniref:Uncharacterized protein n=1 Tax=Fuerstiella marisgermanici TaxID=1891926 RepID=A0A1P8WF68_9PLAN|nr:hypothetical protein Fuma_02324 [Fuerstiella marisgermanici]